MLTKQLAEGLIKNGPKLKAWFTKRGNKKMADEMGELTNKAKKELGFDFIGKNLDSIRLSKLEIEDWIKEIRRLGADVRFIDESKEISEYFKLNNAGAAFNHADIPPTIWIRRGEVTDLEKFHESMHLEDFLRRGIDKYSRGINRELLSLGNKSQIPLRDQLISKYIKEKYVLDKILEEQEAWIKKFGYGRFSDEDIAFSKLYFEEDYVLPCLKEGIDIDKILIK